jgi:hypothetical protein
MTNVQALREIYVKLGGTGTDIADNMTIAEALVVIAAVLKPIPDEAPTI